MNWGAIVPPLTIGINKMNYFREDDFENYLDEILDLTPEEKRLSENNNDVDNLIIEESNNEK